MARNAGVSSMAALRNTGYRFTDQDQDMEYVVGLIDHSGLTLDAIREKMYKLTKGVYGVSVSTMANWASGKTRKPRNFTLNWVAYTLGYERVWHKIR